MNKPNDPCHLLGCTLELPCGAVIKNRLIKSAMSDSLADGEGNPTTEQARLYERWAEGGVGLSIVGEVQVDPRFPEKPGNLVLDPHSNLKALQVLTSRASIDETHIWPQLGHAGGLAYSSISQPKGPSELNIGGFRCLGMTEGEVAELPGMYARAAEIAKKSGFTGVQIHAGHGFLLSQFLSPLFNRRTDQYGGSIEARSKIIVTIIEKVRSVVGCAFPIGIKINTSDQIEGGLTQEDALKAISILNQTSIDLIELSGGSYFPGAKSCSDSGSTGPYFVGFAKKAKRLTRIPLVVTGGFKTRAQVVHALSSETFDFVGLGRALALIPDLPTKWLKGMGIDPNFPRFESPPQGGVTAWYTMLLTTLGSDNEIDLNLTLIAAIQSYEQRDKARIMKWLTKYN
ncbi:NADH:flavin oxidoreductase/NADH oxidase family protein [Vibrio sp. DW001]|uniref:NADH:flavin oxidoreductase/NADH oxidase family protein n=1 Tax=Vibrio sp. DW001 TaxID=2912315 RepID=UPI0023AF98B3|nr:NADH:flavin oxidoreductase/NADH oxidase family protein [Vibrio sp. DW001]WED29712.1 NADH:flavin oxidoreductase/NADH oxidase family protein [Vibrio sp. DW001]